MGELLLPIIFAPIRAAEEDDEVYQKVLATQYEDWTTLRLEDFKYNQTKKALNKIGSRLLDIEEDVLAKPERVDTIPARQEQQKDDSAPVTGDEESEPGLIDLLVTSSEAGDEVGAATKRAAAALQDIQEQLNQAANPAPTTPNESLKILKEIAAAMDEPSRRFETEAKRIETGMRKIDQLVYELIAASNATVFSDAQRDQIKQQLEQFRVLPGALPRAFGSDLQGRQQLIQYGRMSRDLKGPISNLERGLLSIDAADDMTKRWVHAIGPPPPSGPQTPPSDDDS